MPSTKLRKHNWNQIHKVATTKLGFKQVSDYKNEFIYYRRGDGPVVIVQKSNILSLEYVKKVIPSFGISYDEFVGLYND